MFEKEAEEYVRKIRHDVINWGGKEPEERFYNEIKFKQAYLAGAELGYNKAFVEADKNLKAIVTDFNKANEWHYPSKGEYPKEGENVLCYCKCRTEIKFCCVGHTVIGGDNKIRWWSSNRSEELNVYAWKEIVLPKEIKEND